MRLVAFGDSISAAPGSWVELLARALDAELVNHAVPGKEAHTVAEQQLPLLSGRFDFGTLYVGTNDVRRAWEVDRYTDALGLCAKTISGHVDRLFMPTLPLSLYRLPGRGPIGARVAEANAIIRETAESVSAEVVDLDDCRGRGYWSGDHIHPSAAGQVEIARRAVFRSPAPLPVRAPLLTYAAGSALAAVRALVGRGPA